MNYNGNKYPIKQKSKSQCTLIHLKSITKTMIVIDYPNKKYFIYEYI